MVENHDTSPENSHKSPFRPYLGTKCSICVLNNESDAVDELLSCCSFSRCFTSDGLPSPARNTRGVGATTRPAGPLAETGLGWRGVGAMLNWGGDF